MNKRPDFQGFKFNSWTVVWKPEILENDAVRSRKQQKVANDQAMPGQSVYLNIKCQLHEDMKNENGCEVGYTDNS